MKTQPDPVVVNRFEVIDHTRNGEGRILSKWEDFNFIVEVDIQDMGCTLKVFLKEPPG